MPADHARQAPAGPELLNAFRQPAQPKEEKHRRYGFHDELGQRKVGRGQPDEAEAGDEACTAEQDQRRQTVELRLIGGAERAGDPNCPNQRESDVKIARRRGPNGETPCVNRRERGDERDSHQQLQLGLETVGAERALEPSRQPPRQDDENPVEDPLGTEVAQNGRTLDAAEQVGAQHDVHRDSPSERDDAHQELGGETMPGR